MFVWENNRQVDTIKVVRHNFWTKFQVICKNLFSYNSETQTVTATHQRPLRKKSPYSEFLWSVFSRMRAEYGEILVSLRIQPGCGKIRTIKTPNTDTFYAVLFIHTLQVESQPSRSELWLGPPQTSKIKNFATIVNDF